MSEKLSAEEHRQVILSKLEAEHPFFSDAYRRFERSEGMDGQAKRDKILSLHIIDPLLDKLNLLELEAIPTLPEAEPQIVLGQN